MSDEERERKSWREIDKQRDRSAHRRDEPRPSEGRSRRGQRSQKSYRTALDQLFSTGKIAEVVQQKTGETAVPRTDDGDNRIRLLMRIRDAGDRDELVKSVDALLRHYDLPDEADVLMRVLEHPSQDLQLRAMQRLEALPSGQSPRRSRALTGQLRMIRDLSDDPELSELAIRLLARFDGF